LTTKYFSGDEIKKKFWAGHVARMGRGEVYTWYWWGSPREKDHLEEPWFGEMYWTKVAQSRDRRWEFVNVVSKFTVS